ncbi:MAG TPA: neutral/alkaline non-lysosomal ceramidase N-terminal domain-containing protein [Verrucomicrobiae bacterium]|nr:neutral/alkaline non-lysosomal ceramidase N-terminal domain-containing protein [Verrucomicrobiae bacterium]
MAEIDITPPIGYRMAGYFNERFSTAIHDPLMAKALVLRQGNVQVAMVFCDLVGLSLHVSKKARELASQRTGIPVSHIVMAATHSHTGPLFDDVRGDYFHQAMLAKTGQDPHLMIDYPAFLTDQLVKVVVAAQKKLQPATLEAGIAQLPGLAFNRRYYMKDGTVRFNPGILNPNIVGPAGPTDPDVSMLIVKNRDGQAMGGLTVFAMHCDSIGGTQYSADYPYYIQQTLRSNFGPAYISAFGAGTCGNINHLDVSKKQNYSGFDVAERNGDRIGQTVVQNLPNLKFIEHPSLDCKSQTLMLPFQTVTPDQVKTAKLEMAHLDDPKTSFQTRVKTVQILDLARHGKVWPMEVQVFRLDHDTAIVCLPAEIFVEFGLAIKKASPFKRTFVITICNDRPAYVPTLKAFSEGGYEVWNSRVKPGGGEKLTDTAIRLLDELKRNEKTE